LGRDQVHLWRTREALHLTPDAFDGDRPETIAWDDDDVLMKFIRSGNLREARPAFRENLLDVVKGPRAPWPLPVLDSRIEKVRGEYEWRVFDVLLPVAVRPDVKPMFGKSAGSKGPPEMARR
jgi:hypothetical protein